MTSTDYLISGALVALVFLQIRGRRLTPFNLLWPLGLVVWAAITYLHGVPTSGNSLILVVLGAGLGLALGVTCAIFTIVRPGPDGVPFAKAGAVAAGLWILGTGSRLAFEIYATHGGGPAIGRFSSANGISIEAWGAALILMALAEVLGRSGVLAVRAFRAPKSRGSYAPSGSGSAPGLWRDRVTRTMIGARENRS